MSPVKSIPVPVEQMREDLRLHLRLRPLLITLLVARIVFAVRIDGKKRTEYSAHPGDQTAPSASVLMLVSLCASPIVPVAVSNGASQICWPPSRELWNSICLPSGEKRPRLSPARESVSGFSSPPAPGTIHKCEVRVFFPRSTFVTPNSTQWPSGENGDITESPHLHHVFKGHRTLRLCKRTRTRQKKQNRQGELGQQRSFHSGKCSPQKCNYL